VAHPNPSILTSLLPTNARKDLDEGYILSPPARADLDAIWDYSAETWGDEQAERYVRDIRAACGALASGHKKGRSAEDIRGGYRKLSVGSHLLFYRTTDEGVIDVIRILHQHMDLPSHFDHSVSDSRTTD
jgi:toxin ParE1/3/4